MLKLNASYSKKVPVEGQDYSSQSYHASVEIEIPDGLTSEQLQARIHQTFALVEDSVEAELTGNHPDSKGAPQGARIPAGPASPAQIQYLTDLAIRSKMDLKKLNAEAGRLFQVGDVAELTKKQASELIDRLKDQRRAA
jgi:hypothetical protein